MQNLDGHLILFIFGGYAIKLLALGASLPDVGIMLVLGAAHYLHSAQVSKHQINVLKQEVNEAKLEMKNEVHRLSAMLDEHRTSLTAIKMAQGVRTVK